MNADLDRTIQTSLAPAEFLDLLRAATVSYESIIDRHAPLSGYATYVEQALTGAKTVVSRIETKSFMLMPIGIWPAKGQTPLANAGALYGTVEATSTGTRITTRHRLSIGLVAFFGLFAAVSAGLIALTIVASVVYPETEGLLQLQAIAAASALFTLMMVVYYGIGGRQQRRILDSFLRQLCDRAG